MFNHMGFHFDDNPTPEDIYTVYSSYKDLPGMEEIKEKYSGCGRILNADERYIVKFGQDKVPLSILFYDTKTYSLSACHNHNHPREFLAMCTGKILQDYNMRVRNHPYQEWWTIHSTTSPMDDKDTIEQPCMAKKFFSNFGALSARATSYSGIHKITTTDLSGGDKLSIIRIESTDYLSKFPSILSFLTLLKEKADGGL